MFTQAERARTPMDATRDHRYRIAAATQIDEVFAEYEIAMTPEEALSFMATAPADSDRSEAIYIMTTMINDLIPRTNFGPNHPRTGTPHHIFRVGRSRGDRMLKLELFKGYFTKDYPFDELLEKIRVCAEKTACSIASESDENVHQFTFIWSTRADQ